MTLTKADLSEILFNKVGLNKSEAKEMVEAFFEEIKISLENGDNVTMVMTDSDSFSVDTEEDRIFVEEKMMEDQLMKNYNNNG